MLGNLSLFVVCLFVCLLTVLCLGAARPAVCKAPLGFVSTASIIDPINGRGSSGVTVFYLRTGSGVWWAWPAPGDAFRKKDSVAMFIFMCFPFFFGKLCLM